MRRSEPEDLVSVNVTNLGIEGIEDIEQIGSGGSSRVYRARQVDLDRVVAIKVINASHSNDVARRFDRERKAMGRLSLHEGIVSVYTSGITAHGEPYLIMPFFSNGSLQDQIDMGAMEWETAVNYVDAAAETIAAAHDEDVVHLDLKPANILLTKSGAPRIADFGIAKLGGSSATQTTGSSAATAFTPAYSAPETFLDGETGPASDVYGLGATLWALLVGHPPFLTPGEDTNLMAVIGRVVNTPVSDLRHFVPAPICDVIERAMAKHPQNRYQTAREFSQALKAAGADARSDASQAATVTTETAMSSEADSNQTQVFQNSSGPEPRPVAGSVQYVPPLNPTPAVAESATAAQPSISQKPLLETSADVYAGPSAMTAGPLKEPIIDWDEFRALPLLIGMVALALIGGLSIWALTRDGGAETETAGIDPIISTAPEAPGADSPFANQPDSNGSATSETNELDTEEQVTTSSRPADVTTSTESSTSSTSSSTSSTTESDVIPNEPENRRALVQADGSVVISWSEPTGEAPSAYEIFRDDLIIATVRGGTSSYTDTTVEPGEQYLYSLRSVGSTPTIVSDRTPAISVSVPDNTPLTPGVPTNLRFNIQSDGTSVVITWTAPTGTVPQGYEIFRDNISLAVVTNRTSYTDTSTLPGETYSYKLQSLGEGDDNVSPQTQASEVEIPDSDSEAPQPPTDLSNTFRPNGNVELTWTAPTATPAPTGYEVFRDGAELATVSDALQYRDATIVEGETYTYSVRSVGPDGATSARTPSITVEIPESEPVLTLTLTTGSVSDDEIVIELAANVCSEFRVSWTDSENNTQSSSEPAIGCADSVEIIISDLEADADYQVLATAETESGQTAAATPREITTEP